MSNFTYWPNFSSLHHHMQHQPTKEKPHLISKIFAHAAVQIKNKTLFGALTHQILIQGKELAFVPWIDS